MLALHKWSTQFTRLLTFKASSPFLVFTWLISKFSILQGYFLKKLILGITKKFVIDFFIFYKINTVSRFESPFLGFYYYIILSTIFNIAIFWSSTLLFCFFSPCLFISLIYKKLRLLLLNFLLRDWMLVIITPIIIYIKCLVLFSFIKFSFSLAFNKTFFILQYISLSGFVGAFRTTRKLTSFVNILFDLNREWKSISVPNILYIL